MKPGAFDPPVTNSVEHLAAGATCRSCGGAAHVDGAGCVRCLLLGALDEPAADGRKSLDDALAETDLAEGERRLGDYVVVGEIGRGGTGRVLDALDQPLHRSVALKVLSEGNYAGERERFVREARITARLEHPSIIPVHELNADASGRIFYAMKRVKGMTLLQILKDIGAQEAETLGRYPFAACLTIFQKVCDAVAFAHAQPEPIIHRDLKPDNIMVGEFGEVLVMDWGSAKIIRGDNSDDLAGSGLPRDAEATEPSDPFVTHAGMVMGTPGYMAPEQATGRAAACDERTDIYALGAVLYTLLTLEPPGKLTSGEAETFHERAHAGEDVADSFRACVTPLLNSRARVDHLPGRRLPASLVAVVCKAMAPAARDRFAAVKELQADVAAYQAGFAPTAEAARPWKRCKLLVARHKVISGAIATTIAIFAAAMVISLQQRAVALQSNQALQATLHQASFADHEAARQRFRAGAWREGLALMGRSIAFWPQNRAAADYLLRSIVFGRGDADKLPLYAVEHAAPVYEAAFSPDGASFVTASYDHTARIWLSESGAPVGKVMEHSAPLCSARFSPDGRKLVTATEDGFARLWDAKTGEPLGRPMEHGTVVAEDSRARTVESAVFSPDGRRVLTSCWDHYARVWDVETGAELGRMLNPDRVANAVFSPDGTRILTCFWYGGAMLWDAATFLPLGSTMLHKATVRKAVFSPDGSRVVTAGLDKTARIWNGYTGAPISAALLHDDRIWSVAVSPDGRFFATACCDKTARLWSLADGSPIGVPMQHDGPVDSVAFNADGTLLLTASRDKTVRLWDTATCKQQPELMRHDDSALGAIFSPDGSRVLSFGLDRVGYMWSTSAAPAPGEILPIPGRIRLASFTAEADRILVTDDRGTVGLWSPSQSRFIGPRVEHGSAVVRTAVAPGGSIVATAGTDGVDRIWDIHTGAKLGETTSDGGALSAALFAPDGRSLFTASSSGAVAQWQVPEGTAIGLPMKHSGRLFALAVSPSGDEIATSADDVLVRFWDARSHCQFEHTVRLQDSAVAISYHPAGHTLATGSMDQTARLWSLDDDKQVGAPLSVTGPAAILQHIMYGRALLVGGPEDGVVNCYDLENDRALFLSLQHAGGITDVSATGDGREIITVGSDGQVRHWRVPAAGSAELPLWLGEYLRAFGGLFFTPEQHLAQVSTRERLQMRTKLLENNAEPTAWGDVLAWSFRRNATGEAAPPARSRVFESTLTLPTK